MLFCIEHQDIVPNLKQLQTKALLNANWFTVDDNLPNHQKSWLLEAGSMTARLKTHCDVFSIDSVEQYSIENTQLTKAECLLLGNDPCLVREVQLLGNGMPWVTARSLIPYSTLCDNNQELGNLGMIPLGERVFSVANAYRDKIEMAFVHIAKQKLLARRSRLWVNAKPLLVAELFLPLSPIYHYELRSNLGEINAISQS